MKTSKILFWCGILLCSTPAFNQVNSNSSVMITTEQKLHLQELIAGYSLASDNKDVQGHMNYYANNGFIDGGMKTGTKATTMAADLAQIFAMEGTLKRHFALNHQFRRENDAIIVEYLLMVVEGEHLPMVMASGQIRDEFIEENGQWKLRRHLIQIDPAMFNLMKQMQEAGNAPK